MKAPRKKSITLLGLGNILLGDEGFGVHFLEWFLARYRLPEGVRAVDGGTLGHGLLDVVCGCERLIVIDVIKVDDTPGSIYRFDRSEMESHMPEPTSAHEVEFVDVLYQAELMDQCPETQFLLIVPENYADMEIKMSPVMIDGFSGMEGVLLEALSNFGIHPAKS